VAPYWKILEKAAAALGAPIEPIEAAGGKVLTCNLGSGKAAEALRGSLLGGFEPSPPELQRLALLTIGSGLSVTRADLAGGWTALASLPQAVVRHVEGYATGPKLAADGELAMVLKAQLPGATAVEVHQGDRSFLYAYNTAVTLLVAFAPLLAVAGVQPAHLPPAERFLGEARAGFLRLEAGPEGFTLRVHRGLGTSTTALAAVGAGALMAGFLVPVIARGRGEAYTVQCANNLKQLYGLALVYSEEAGEHAFPYSPDGSVAALRLLIEHVGHDAVHPQLFACPEGGHQAPEVEDGKVVLTGETCSYELVPWRLKVTAPEAIWMYDKQPHHRGRRNVLFSDGSISILEEGEFQERLASEKERAAKRAAPAKKKAPASKAKKKAKKAPAEDGE
jgi:prepilin-type processing-associated H-X9-DG protein